jgi:hypothetical protein
MVRKLLTAVVAFGTIIPNHPSIITLSGKLPVFGLLDKKYSTVYQFGIPLNLHEAQIKLSVFC